jgi:hypothetical protein
MSKNTRMLNLPASAPLPVVRKPFSFEGKSYCNKVEKKCQVKHALFRKKNRFFANIFFREKKYSKNEGKNGCFTPVFEVRSGFGQMFARLTGLSPA